MQTNVGFHHFHLRKFHEALQAKNHLHSPLVQIIDRLVYAGAFIVVLFTIPQLTKIWVDRQVQGLSLITWLGFFGGSLFWLFYGIVHRAKPVVIINLIYGIVNLLIVIGIIIFK